MLDGFKKFIFRGNVVDLAVGVIIGAAFGAVVASLTKDILTPLIGAIGGKPDFSALKLGPLMIGNFINAVVNFLIQAGAIYFLVILPMNKLMKFGKKEEAAAPTTKECPFCASTISIKATRCPNCTSELGAK